MSVTCKLLIEHHLQKEATQAHLSLFKSKCHIVHGRIQIVLSEGANTDDKDFFFFFFFYDGMERGPKCH